MIAPTSVMTVALIVNSATLAKVVSIPQCLATVSSSPITRKRKPKPRARDQPAQQEHGCGQRQQLPVDIGLGDVDEDIAAEQRDMLT